MDMLQHTDRVSLIVHGGAGDIPDEEVLPAREGCREAVETGWHMLQAGAAALDVVENVVKIMEDNPVFDAGRGSFMNANGEIEMDAILVDGMTLRFGAVAAIQRVKNPIQVARLVMERTSHVLLVGAGAEAFARSMGIPECRVEDLRRPEVFNHPGPEKYGTIGAIVRDRQGNLAAATSTGGMKNKMPGRVGDSPIIGSGVYADNLFGGASATGEGEALMKIIFCKMACDLMAKGMATQPAAEETLDYLARRVEGKGGIIMMNPQGEIGWAFNTRRMTCGWVTPEGRIIADCHEFSALQA